MCSRHINGLSANKQNFEKGKTAGVFPFDHSTKIVRCLRALAQQVSDIDHVDGVGARVVSEGRRW